LAQVKIAIEEEKKRSQATHHVGGEKQTKSSMDFEANFFFAFISIFTRL
jgi:hypothetical protein